MRVQTLFCSMVVGLAVLVGSDLRADIIVANLTEPFRSNTPIANPEYWAAQSFFTDGNSYLLNSVDILGGNATGSPDVVAELRRATGPLGEIDMSPSGLLGTFLAPDLTGPESIRTFLPTGSITLDSDTQYWFMLGANSGTFDWSYADSGLFSGAGYLWNYSDSSDAGATWVLRSNDFPYFIQVNGSPGAIPEPASVWLIGGLLSLVGACRMRRRHG